MKKLLFLLAMLITNIAIATPSGVVVSMKNKPTCSHEAFWKQAKAFKIIEDRTYYSKFNAGIYPSALITNTGITANVNKYKAWSQSSSVRLNKLANPYFDNYLTTLKKSIETKYSCLSLAGPDIKIEFNSALNGIDGYNLYSSIDYQAFAQKYPLRASEPVVYLVDTVMNNNKILSQWRNRVLPGFSFVPGYPQPVDRDTGFDQHADDMSFLTLATSDAKIYPVAIGINDTKKTGLLQAKLAAGIEHSIEDSVPVKQNVINASWGSRHGNPPDVKQAFADAVRNNITVVQAIGNKNEHTWTGITYDDNIITVGFVLSNGASGTDGLVLQSDYGNDGPDLVWNEDGKTPYTEDAVTLRSKDFRKVYSSGAAAATSGIVSRMRNSCPDASPKMIKEALCKTATKLKAFPDNKTQAINDLIGRQYNYKNSLVNCGVINPMEAADYLMTKPECLTKSKLLTIGYFGNSGNQLTTKSYAITQISKSPNVLSSSIRSEFAADGTENLFIALSDGSNDNYVFWHQCTSDDTSCLSAYNNEGYNK